MCHFNVQNVQFDTFRKLINARCYFDGPCLNMFQSLKSDTKILHLTQNLSMYTCTCLNNNTDFIPTTAAVNGLFPWLTLTVVQKDK